jgi:hypothetical protein
VFCGHTDCYPATRRSCPPARQLRAGGAAGHLDSVYTVSVMEAPNCPICSPQNSALKIADSALEVCLVVQPHQSVTPGAALRFNSRNAGRATPSSSRTPIDHSLPVSRRTAKDSVRYPGEASISTCQRLPTASAAVRAPNQEVLGHTLDRIAQSPKEALTARMISDEILTRQCSNAIRKLGVFCLV